MISHIDHVVLTVADIERSVAFYQRVLRMEAVTFGSGRRALKFGQQKIYLQTLGQELRNRAGVGAGDLCLITEWALPDVMAHLAAEGVPLLEGPVTRSGAVAQLLPQRLQVDLLLAELQRAATVAEADGLHAQHTGVERDRALDVGNREDDVVDVRNHGVRGAGAVVWRG